MSIAQQTDRDDRLAALLPEAGIDVLLVTDLVNVRYLTGYSGSNGLALVGRQLRAFITDFRYVEQAADEVEQSFERRKRRWTCWSRSARSCRRGRCDSASRRPRSR